MVAFFFKSRSIQICQMRSIQSGEKERADLSGHSRRGHLVLVCAERRRPCLLLQVNKLHRRPAAQMGVAKSDFLSDASQQSGFDKEHGAFHSDWSRSIWIWKRMQPLPLNQNMTINLLCTLKTAHSQHSEDDNMMMMISIMMKMIGVVVVVKMTRTIIIHETWDIIYTFLENRLQLRFKNVESRITDNLKAAEAFNQLPSLHALL